METWQIVLLIVGIVLILLVGGIIFTIIYTNSIAEKLFQKQWVRQDPSKFPRGCSDKGFDYHLDMYNQGMAFRESVISKISEVEITSLNTKLCGEYYDFGFRKAIIILPGRMETCYYGAYYAEAFIKGGYNVLCIDPRAHGLSGGDKLTLGFDESIDAIEWAKFLHENKGVESIALYGLCGGATCACLTLVNKDCPSYVNAFIADGMFYSFYDVYKRHIKDEKKPVYPVIWELFHKIKKNNHCNPYKAAPNKLIKDVKVPLLIISGNLDKFAVPENAEKMFASAGSSDKKIVHIANARHSHVRYDNKADYDEAVVDFLSKH